MGLRQNMRALWDKAFFVSKVIKENEDLKQRNEWLANKARELAKLQCRGEVSSEKLRDVEQEIERRSYFPEVNVPGRISLSQKPSQRN